MTPFPIGLTKTGTILFYVVAFGFQFCKPTLAQVLPPTAKIDTVRYLLKNKDISLISYRYGDPHIRFIALHDTEKTGVKAALKFIGIYGGHLLELQYGNDRNISFRDSNYVFSFDPNNIFTAEGSYTGLAKYSAVPIRRGLDTAIKQFGVEVLRQWKVGGLNSMIALHNNYNGGFSVFSYTPGNLLEGIASDVYINPKMDPDDFVFVNERRLYEYLKSKGINAVLQDFRAIDDGSLSIYAMQNRIPYANIEVQHGNLAENYRLIVAVNEMMKELLTEYPFKVE